ncbi:GerAB/ArcD/ProY family transporter [Paenibacillus tundrae]|uniref:Spore germination protein KB n=1 Tax=Paenibacillus tundrae TaxID=528187 RepID=A0ABT9W7U7_9BACL|nr:endospore germination permease [Paenibacillus tundrae]MDQ0169317.1 spore germination protein KB [Paenibacillus tundrae]
MSKLTPKLSDLVVTFCVFEVGSTTLFLLGGNAKQDAWIAMLIAASIGFLLLLMYLWIHQLDKGKDLYELLQYYIGKIPGGVLGFFFAIHFMYETSRNLRDMGEVTVLTLLNRTPIAFIMLVAILVVGNTVRYGPEVLMRTCTFLFPIVILSYTVLIVLITAAGLLHVENMQPILEKGLPPVWSAAFPEIVSFPFGQTVLFLVFFKITEHDSKFNKALLSAYGVVSIILTIINQINIIVLGPSLAINASTPLLETIQLIQFAGVLERMDAIFALVLFLGLGIKMAAFFIGAVTGLSRITNIKYKLLILPTGITIYFLSFLSPRYTEYIWLGLNVSVKWVSPFFQILIPLLLLAFMLLQKKKRLRATQNTGEERQNRI